jgi:hypothetical protein
VLVKAEPNAAASNVTVQDNSGAPDVSPTGKKILSVLNDARLASFSKSAIGNSCLSSCTTCAFSAAPAFARLEPRLANFCVSELHAQLLHLGQQLLAAEFVIVG